MAKKPINPNDCRQQKIDEITSLSDLLPVVTVIHDLPGFSVVYMSDLGLKLLDKKWDEIKGLSNEEYHRQFFNEDDSNNYVPKILQLPERNTDEAVPFFQQVRTSKNASWDWYMSATRILARDERGTPSHSITIAMQIDPAHYFTAKATRLLEENLFLRTHFREFGSLTKREKDVLRLLALGKTASAIARELNISANTAETHRKNIRHKLKARTKYDLERYARVFDLI